MVAYNIIDNRRFPESVVERDGIGSCMVLFNDRIPFVYFRRSFDLITFKRHGFASIGCYLRRLSRSSIGL